MGSSCNSCCKRAEESEKEEDKFALQDDATEDSSMDKRMIALTRDSLMKVVNDIENETTDSSGYPGWYFTEADDKIITQELDQGEYAF